MNLSWKSALPVLIGFVIGVYADSIPVVATVAAKMPGRKVAKIAA